ncbi:hypothetical protein D3C75_598760 [compost metagenome]
MIELTKERLQQLAIEDDLVNYPPEQWELNEMARQLLAGLEQEPVIIVGDDGGDALAYRRLIQIFAPGTKLYAAPQLPPPAVVIPLAVSWEDVPEEITEDDMSLASAWAHGFNQCRAAMLQGKAEPVSQPYTLPAGMVAVPVEPTAEMLAELCLVEGWTERALQSRYKAMLAAAPQQEDPHQKK